MDAPGLDNVAHPGACPTTAHHGAVAPPGVACQSNAVGQASTTPLFSIVTACFNARQTLPATLESLRAQTWRDFEWIVVDGGSTDGTLAWLDEHRGDIHTLVPGPDRGISDAFNKGIAVARGAWVGILNADDAYLPHTLATVAALAGGRPEVELWCGKQRYVDTQGVPLTVFDANPALLRTGMTVNHAASFSRRELYTRHGGFKLEYRAAMDYELYLRFATRGAVLERTDAILAVMALGGTSDRHWQRALAEVRQAQLEHGVGFVEAQARFGYGLLKGRARRVLERLGADTVVDFYRRRLALVNRGEP